MANDEELNRLMFERDLAIRQAKLAKVGLQVVRMALEENRPLEALRQVNEEMHRLNEELDALEDIADGDGHEEVDR